AQVDPGPSTRRLEPSLDVHGGLAPTLLVGTVGPDHDRLGGVVPFDDLGTAGEVHAHRAERDRDGALVFVGAHLAVQVGAGEARGYPRDVLEERPGLLDRLGYLERVLNLHARPPRCTTRGPSQTPPDSPDSRSSRWCPHTRRAGSTRRRPPSSRRPDRWRSPARSSGDGLAAAPP